MVASGISAMGAAVFAMGGARDADALQALSSARADRLLQGQVALVTGAARGIGRAYAVAFARAGAHVACVDLAANIASVEYALASPAELEETRRLVEAEGRRALAIRADVRDLAQMQAAVRRTVAELGGLDVAVPNAGILTMAPLAEMSPAAWRDVIDVNLTGVAHTMMAVLPHMRERRRGRIIATVSCNARSGAPGSPSYNASKWGALGLVKSVAAEEAKHGITVNCVNPTGVATAMSLQPKYREQFRQFLRQLNAQDRDFIEPDEVAAAGLFFASSAAAVITGEALDVAAGANTRWNS